MAISGLINLYKPAGISSAKYAYRLRPVLGTRKVGHAGALDPFADGVLVVCAGKATKLVERLMGLEKLYQTQLRLGVTNATLDPERPFEPVPGSADPGPERVRQVVAGFEGLIQQVPPIYSAVKVAGRPAYRRARLGENVELTAKSVRVYHIEVVSYAYPLLELMVRCGRGTYIRALARDIGSALGTGACCQTLRRLAVGPFRIEQSVRLDEWTPEQILAAVLTVEQVERLLGPVPGGASGA